MENPLDYKDWVKLPDQAKLYTMELVQIMANLEYKLDYAQNALEVIAYKQLHGAANIKHFAKETLKELKKEAR